MNLELVESKGDVDKGPRRAGGSGRKGSRTTLRLPQPLFAVGIEGDTWSLYWTRGLFGNPKSFRG